jgi:hypothetical protein
MNGILADVQASFGEHLAGMGDLLSQFGGDGADALGKLGDLFPK